MQIPTLIQQNTQTQTQTQRQTETHTDTQTDIHTLIQGQSVPHRQLTQEFNWTYTHIHKHTNGWTRTKHQTLSQTYSPRQSHTHR